MLRCTNNLSGLMQIKQVSDMDLAGATSTFKSPGIF